MGTTQQEGGVVIRIPFFAVALFSCVAAACFGVVVGTIFARGLGW
jgi:hypothetical protein